MSGLNGSWTMPSTPTTSRWPLSISAGALAGPMLATTFVRPGTLSSNRTSKPQSSRTDARNRAHSPSPGDSGTRVGFLESICISARASATASPGGMATAYLFFADFAEALGLAFATDLTGFFAAGFMVGFFAVGFLAGAACLTGCLTGVAGTWRAGVAWVLAGAWV